VQLRFEYITDAAVNGEGLLLDDIRMPEIGYQTDFEAGRWRLGGRRLRTHSEPAAANLCRLFNP
jgi:hypothetical protein